MNNEIAITILKQLGGNRFIAFTGAKNFSAQNKSIGFMLPKAKNTINTIKITLNEMDTYDIEFLNIRKERKIISKIKGIYNDQLTSIFEKETGLYTPF